MWGHLIENKIDAVNPNNKDGCTGWQEIPDGLTVNSPLTDEKGAFLYKLVDGAIVERSQEEREADWPPEPEPPTTLEDVVEGLNALLEMITGGEE